uniref:Uncharacterized protein n=1 Tax=Anguilla anguilla TaxID=7936 RepID=A0A0E9XFT9_ANGAN
MLPVFPYKHKWKIDFYFADLTV